MRRALGRQASYRVSQEVERTRDTALEPSVLALARAGSIKACRADPISLSKGGLSKGADHNHDGSFGGLPLATRFGN
jgi:hypothetical protein